MITRTPPTQIFDLCEEEQRKQENEDKKLMSQFIIDYFDLDEDNDEYDLTTMPVMGSELMAVDLSKARIGDKVKFRCGGEAEISEIDNGDNDDFSIRLKGHGRLLRWYARGRYFAEGEHLLDIINIEPAPFDWATVKPGMAFQLKLGLPRPVYFIGWSMVGNGFGEKQAIMQRKGERQTFPTHPGNLIRAPEHDINVPI